MKQKDIFILVCIALIAASRLINIPNFTPMLSLAMFGGALFSNRITGIVAPLVILFCSDILLAFSHHDATFTSYILSGDFLGMYSVYLMTTFIGSRIKNNFSIGKVFGGIIFSAILFYVVTNFISWIVLPEYTKNFSGLMLSYERAIQFFKTNLLSNILTSGIMFFVYKFYENKLVVVEQEL